MASIALAIWIFLFGSGKYKSWGVVQRYVLQTSPNSRRFRGTEATPKNPLEAAKMFVRDQIARMDTSAEHDLDNVPLQASTEEHRRVLSARYSKAFDMEAAAAAVASGATMTRNGNGGARERGVSLVDGNSYGSDNADHRLSQYSIDMNAPPNFYFSDQGAPLSRSLQPLRPVGSSADDAEEQVDELIRLIDLRMDERMWSLEKTLSRYYLDGFRLRNYSASRSFRLSDTKEQSQAGHLGAGYDTGNEYFGQYPPPPSHVELIQDDAGSRAGGEEQLVSRPLPPPPTPAIPQYPPRPQVRDRFDYVIDVHAPPPPPTIGISPIQSQDSKSDFGSPSASSSSATPFLNPGFPERKDMRGTIRRAVERLQQEWPQSHATSPTTTEAYVPRTQYNNVQYQQQQQS